MKIFNEEKTQELKKEELDFELGFLKADKRLIAHHDAVEGRNAVYADRIFEEENGGISVYKDLVSSAVEEKEEWDEYEDIQVYISYNAEELKNIFRAKRISLLDAFDKWEKAVLRGREKDKGYIMAWYYDLLDLKENAFENIPEEIKYYL